MQDYGADAGKPKLLPVPTDKKPPAPPLVAIPPPPPATQPPSTPLVGTPPPPGPERPSEPLVAIPPPSKPVEKPSQPVPPTTTIIIQQRTARGASDQAQSADTFLQFDTNRDGMVDQNEADASGFLSANFNVIDTNRDGKLSEAEMRAFDARPK